MPPPPRFASFCSGPFNSVRPEAASRVSSRAPWGVRVMTSAPAPPPPLSQWDRDPSLIIDPLTGAVTTTKAYDILRKNFIIANYNSLGAVDNDDGSSYYISESNFFVYGGGGGFLSRGWR